MHLSISSIEVNVSDGVVVACSDQEYYLTVITGTCGKSGRSVRTAANSNPVTRYVRWHAWIVSKTIVFPPPLIPYEAYD